WLNSRQHDWFLIGRSRCDWRRRFRCCRLGERFQNLPQALLVRLGLSRGWTRSLWRCRRSSFRIAAGATPGLGGNAGQQLKKDRDRDKQQEKKIIEMRGGNHFQLASVRGLSDPAIDSRIEVSAWTFFIR